jgi:uncharacterized protein RhaS with RHS repeats
MAVRRFYDPDLGRWISRDPIGEIGGVNLYQYVSMIRKVTPIDLVWIRGLLISHLLCFTLAISSLE